MTRPYIRPHRVGADVRPVCGGPAACVLDYDRPGGGPDTLHGWHACVAADALARYPHVTAAIDEARARNRDVERAARNAIAGTGVWLAGQASERGARVHDYAEQVARYYLGVGMRDEIAEVGDRLAAHDELGYAAQFDDWL